MKTRKDIAVARVAVERALAELDNTVKERFKIGDQVEYLHGAKWIGPCTIEMIRESHNVHGPEIRVSNNTTGKFPPPLSAERIRHIGEAWRDIWSGHDLLEEARAEQPPIIRH